MIIIYPTENWNSFLPLSDLIGGMKFQFPTKVKEFQSMSTDMQMASAANAGMWIRTCKGLKIPEHVIPQDMVLAQIAIMASTIGIDPLEHNPSDRAITKEKVGSLEVEYDPKFKGNDPDINPLIYRLLSPYGCSGNKGFSQSNTSKA